jgi:hypothetical protein
VVVKRETTGTRVRQCGFEHQKLPGVFGNALRMLAIVCIVEVMTLSWRCLLRTLVTGGTVTEVIVCASYAANDSLSIHVGA